MATRIRLEGDRELIAALLALGPRVGDALEAALTAGGQVIANAARENAPKDGGTLARSIAVVTASKTPTSAAVNIGPQVEYGVYVEYGTGIYAEAGNGRQTPWVYYKNGRFYRTRGMRPQPYLRPAFDANADQALQVMQAALGAVVRAMSST